MLMYYCLLSIVKQIPRRCTVASYCRDHFVKQIEHTFISSILLVEVNQFLAKNTFVYSMHELFLWRNCVFLLHCLALLPCRNLCILPSRLIQLLLLISFLYIIAYAPINIFVVEARSCIADVFIVTILR